MTDKNLSRAEIKNLGFGLPNIGDTVLLDGQGLSDAIFIRHIVHVAEPSRAPDGTLWQSTMTVTGSIVRDCAVEDCVSEYVATAKLCIQCLACGGSMKRGRAHFAEGLSAVPNMSGASLECEKCGEFMHERDAVLTGWATEAELRNA